MKIITISEPNLELAQDKRIVNQAVDNHITDMIKHFNNPSSDDKSESDERYVYSKKNLDKILAGLTDVNSVKVTPLKDKGEFYCYRLDRVLAS